MENRLQLCLVLFGDKAFFRIGVSFSLLAHRMHRFGPEDTLGPGEDFVTSHTGLKQRGGQRTFPVGAVVDPGMVWIVFNGIVEIPDAFAGGASNILERSILEERGFERTLFSDSVVEF